MFKLAIMFMQYRKELERLEELKKANMTRFIGHLKTELEDWWERCYISEEDRHQCEVSDFCVKTGKSTFL